MEKEMIILNPKDLDVFTTDKKFQEVMHSEETRRKMSEAQKGRRAWNKGKKLGPCSEERRKHISEARKGKPHPHKGHPASEETRKKISETLKGRALGNV